MYICMTTFCFYKKNMAVIVKAKLFSAFNDILAVGKFSICKKIA